MINEARKSVLYVPLKCPSCKHEADVPLSYSNVDIDALTIAGQADAERIVELEALVLALANRLEAADAERPKLLPAEIDALAQLRQLATGNTEFSARTVVELLDIIDRLAASPEQL